MINNAVGHFERVDSIYLFEILEKCKIPNASIIGVPRILFQYSLESSIVGINDNSIVSTSFYEGTFNTPLWKEPSLPYIAFESKQISPFFKQIKDNNLQDRIFLVYNKYIVNGSEISIANSITTDTKVRVVSLKGEEDIYPTINLIPYSLILDKIKFTIDLYNNASTQFQSINLKEDNQFTEIWDHKASDGLLIWKPDITRYDIRLKPYILYLSKCMFPVAKNDSAILTIKDDLPNTNRNYFISLVQVYKKKNKIKSTHNYYFMGVKLI